MSVPNDPIDDFARLRRTSPEDLGEPVLDASNIDDMLDALDRVLSAEETQESQGHEEAAPIVETVRSILDELDEACGRLETAARLEDDPLVLDFVASLRSRLWFLIRRADEVRGPAAGPIEIELDYEGLHDFMLFPDLERIAS